jgi:hypothetical protein
MMAAQTEILLECAHLQLRTYSPFEESASEIRQEALTKAYSTSLILISRFETADTNSNFVSFAPDYFSHILGMAAILVMKIASSSYSRYIDKTCCAPFIASHGSMNSIAESLYE